MKTNFAEMIEARKKQFLKRLADARANRFNRVFRDPNPVIGSNDVVYELAERSQAINYAGVSAMVKLAKHVGLVDSINKHEPVQMPSYDWLAKCGKPARTEEVWTGAIIKDCVGQATITNYDVTVRHKSPNLGPDVVTFKIDFRAPNKCKVSTEPTTSNGGAFETPRKVTLYYNDQKIGPCALVCCSEDTELNVNESSKPNHQREEESVSPLVRNTRIPLWMHSQRGCIGCYFLEHRTCRHRQHSDQLSTTAIE